MPHYEMVNWFSRWWDKRVLDPKNEGDMKSYCLASDAWFAAFKAMDENFTANNNRVMPCLMYAGVNEQCDVLGDGRCGSVACQLART